MSYKAELKNNDKIVLTIEEEAQDPAPSIERSNNNVLLQETFYVELKDSVTGKTEAVEVSEEIYQVYKDFFRLKEKEKRERRFHIDGYSIDDYIANRYENKLGRIESLETKIINRDILFRIFEILEKCTYKQKERFWLNRICGLSYAEIARKENCDIKAVIRSVQAVSAKIKKFF